MRHEYRNHRGGYTFQQPDQVSANTEADKANLVNRMRIVKRTRFNAHARMERKGQFSIFTLSVFALYVIGISLYTTLFAEELPSSKAKVLVFVSVVSSIFIIIVTFTEAMNDYRVKGLSFQRCAMSVARLLQNLEVAEIQRNEELLWYTNQYNNIIDRCPYNHHEVDYQMALAAERQRKPKKNTSDYLFILWRKFRYYQNIYGLYVLLLIAPVGLFYFSN